MKQKEKFVKPAQFTENEILTAIVNNEWPAGFKLPPERELCASLGVTRPTLREVLQRLSRDGWLTITHGKPTLVNDFKQDGGLGVLKTLINHDDLSSDQLIKDWLEFRAIMFPSLAVKSIASHAKIIVDKLNDSPDVQSSGIEFATFDWELQMLMIKLSKNTIAMMLYNDLTVIYSNEGKAYFQKLETKKRSIQYYETLKQAIIYGGNVNMVIESAMTESVRIWNQIKGAE